MPLHSLARIRGELFSPYHTWDEPEHPAVEAIPVLSDGKNENLVLPDCSESWRRLDSAEGRVLSVLFSCPQSDPVSHPTSHEPRINPQAHEIPL